jgi:hypothetical protein
MLAVLHKSRYAVPQEVSMSSTKPRLSVTLSEPTAATLRELSDLTGNSQSAIVGELLEESQSVFARMVRVLRAAKEAQHSVKTEIIGGIDAAQARMEAQLGLALGDMDQWEGKLLADVEAVQRRTKRGGVGGKRSAPAPSSPALPPISNRGVTPHQKGKDQGLSGVRGKSRG